MTKVEDIDAISDYLLSGGSFTDIEVPIMYLKKVMDKDSLINFRAAVTAKINRGADPYIKTLVDALKEMVLARIPCQARLIKMIDHPMMVNRMGDKGAKMDSFTVGLVLDTDQSGWSSMTVAEATILY